MSDPEASPVRIVLHNFRSEVEAPVGVTLLEAVQAAGLGLDAECGGRGTCGGCRVRFLEGAPPPSPEDELLLEPAAIEAGWRLACQVVVRNDCRILIPDVAPTGAMRILTDATVPAETADERPRLTGYGAAVDIGTTTVVCYLVDLARARQIDVASFANPQRAFGADVISRIVYAHQSAAQLAETHDCLVAAIEEHLAGLCSRHGLPTEAVHTLTAVGNLTMMHLFRGVDPWPLGVAPYEPVFTEAPPLPGSELGFLRLARTRVKLLPGVGGHLGSDAVAGLVALGLAHRTRPALFIDLGTNGEIAVLSRRLAAGCSCAAGPAFEGVHISCGMAAVPGAVERVGDEDGRLQLDTIGGAPPLGLCGSGLADAVAILLRRGLLLPTGRLVATDRLPAGLSPELVDRLRQENGPDGRSQRRFVLYEDGASSSIFLTQPDIRQVQLAKAAIRIGVEVLMEETALRPEDIDGVFVGGAFGSSVRAESLLALGVLPEALRGRIHSAGNVAGMGAKLALMFPERFADARRVAHRLQHVQLGGRADFQERFSRHLGFPEG
ncbi:MAG TPA: ASKHA domain-containing protein [Dehalococcoidia bacterium]|nr:ASKHA domain-containing protein [Dehalococcoidia bacterium]